ncbi:MAG: hypothetical protein LBN74_11030 [Prevotella sp.]|jgi:hypothetical protein|nr:hypothetical protein [Prevotella sp.]
MKKLFFTLLTITTIFAFTACGSDDKEQFFFDGNCKQTISLESGPAGGPYTTPTTKASLNDLLKNATNYGSPISTGVLNITGGSTAVKVTGLTDGVTLANFTLKINGLENNFGDVTSVKSNLYAGTVNGQYFQKVFDKMVKTGTLETAVSFTPNVKISDDVKLEIVFDGTFSYWK